MKVYAERCVYNGGRAFCWFGRRATGRARWLHWHVGLWHVGLDRAEPPGGAS